MSQLLDTRRFIWEIQATSFTGASCMATVIGCAPAIRGHALTCLSHPPENTTVPSSFHAEHSTYNTRKTFFTVFSMAVLAFLQMINKYLLWTHDPSKPILFKISWLKPSCQTVSDGKRNLNVVKCQYLCSLI